jgi:hypothetical protein
MAEEFQTQRVLELACAAQRINKVYLKDLENVYDNEGKFLFVKHSNKDLVRWALNINRTNVAQEFAPQELTIEEEDKELAEEIKKYFRRLMFSAIKGDNDFQTEVNSILGTETIPSNKIGYVACLPHVYAKDYVRNQMEKRVKSLDQGYIGNAGSVILNKDCEVLECSRSKNFDAYNVYAIMDNKMVGWMGKKELKIGPAVVSGAKVKDHSEHWKYKNSVTRLNYVKVFQ